MTTTEDKPVDREAWRRLLAGDGDGPSELTDARIRARARQAITPRTGRWWLPASLAASLLLAVVLVQRQYERSSTSTVIHESAYATAPAAEHAAPPREETAVNAQLPPPAAPVIMEGRAAAKEAAADSSPLDGFVANPPVVPPPMIGLPTSADAPAANAAPAAESPAGVAADAESRREEEDHQEIVVTGNRRREDNVESTTPVTQVTSQDIVAQGATRMGGLMKSEATERTPEQWYAEIEKLRATGNKREARRELEKLRKAHPGWLEKHHPTDR